MATRKTKRRRRRKSSFRLKAFLNSRNGMFVKWLGGLLCAALYVYFFYAFIVSPYALRWRGIYSDPVLPSGYSIMGIDISHHQGMIDWEKLHDAEIGQVPVSFVFVKATEGRETVDPNFMTNFVKAREQGMIRGAYHFFSTKAPAEEQAQNFIQQVKLEPGDLPPVLDIEHMGDLTPEQLRQRALVWLRIVERHYGVKPILYTYYKFKQQYLNTKEFRRYPYWIAHYYVDTLRYDGPWKFWQHTDRGRLDGIKGYVDLNVYNGSMYDLKQFVIPDTTGVSPF